MGIRRCILHFFALLAIVVGLQPARATTATTASNIGCESLTYTSDWAVRATYDALLHDEEIGLIYNRARMLHPGVGRFMQNDPLGFVDTVNLYSYNRNDPITRSDPNGTKSDVTVECDSLVFGVKHCRLIVSCDKHSGHDVYESSGPPPGGMGGFGRPTYERNHHNYPYSPAPGTTRYKVIPLQGESDCFPCQLANCIGNEHKILSLAPPAYKYLFDNSNTYIRELIQGCDARLEYTPGTLIAMTAQHPIRTILSVPTLGYGMGYPTPPGAIGF